MFDVSPVGPETSLLRASRIWNLIVRLDMLLLAPSVPATISNTVTSHAPRPFIRASFATASPHPKPAGCGLVTLSLWQVEHTSLSSEAANAPETTAVRVSRSTLLLHSLNVPQRPRLKAHRGNGGLLR